MSILDTILENQKVEEVSKLDAVEIINNLFSELSDRERDVLVRRYGLNTGNKETLESIGAAHDLTRVRFRQIETTSIKKLQQLKDLKNYLNTLRKVILQLLEEHGGLMEKEYLLSLLVGFSLNGFNVKGDTDEQTHKNYLNFLITKLLFDEFEEINSNKHFLESYKLKYKDLEHLEDITEELLEKIKEAKDTHATPTLIDLITELDSFKHHEEKIKTESTLDVAKFLKTDLFEEDPEAVNNNKVLYSILKAARKIEQNKFGHWGVHNSREIKPKTINDKIYLILKNYNKPMHFAEIADAINKISFDGKTANAATVHNELILDKKYVLVGRVL
ncbi:MAG: sigma factor-like helix-turn-helix DNA-binding protein [Candidatus Magasanikbacteria bacterium]|nr:sigma factor-like helix-turn-helix DNA-binding protein [Candidatus Magasanikbacteria bacterium]